MYYTNRLSMLKHVSLYIAIKLYLSDSIIQQLNLEISLANDSATIFIASESVGNIGRKLITSSIVFLFFFQYQ